MTENLAKSDQELFEEVVEKALAEGVANREAFEQMVDDVLEGHRRWMELDDDQNIEEKEEKLKARWPEYEQQLNDQVA